MAKLRKRWGDMTPDEQVAYMQEQSVRENRTVHAPYSETYEELIKAAGLPMKGKRGPGGDSKLYESADASAPWRIQLDK